MCQADEEGILIVSVFSLGVEVCALLVRSHSHEWQTCCLVAIYKALSWLFFLSVWVPKFFFFFSLFLEELHPNVSWVLSNPLPGQIMDSGGQRHLGCRDHIMCSGAPAHRKPQCPNSRSYDFVPVLYSPALYPEDSAVTRGRDTKPVLG